MKITSVQVDAGVGHDYVRVWVDGALTGELVVPLGEGEKLASLLRVQAMARGEEPHWLTKDFNVLYRCARGFYEAWRSDDKLYAPQTHAALGCQLERLKPAFTDTEEVRKWMRERE
jgi:hypothetical protein